MILNMTVHVIRCSSKINDSDPLNFLNFDEPKGESVSLLASQNSVARRTLLMAEHTWHHALEPTLYLDPLAKEQVSELHTFDHLELL